MRIEDGQIIITQKDIDKGLDKILTQENIDKAIKQRFDKIREDALKYGDY